MNGFPILSGLSYSVGGQRPITDIPSREIVPDGVIEQLQSRGLRFYREETRPVTEILWETVSATLSATGFDVTEIDGILTVNSPIDKEILMRSLNEAGFDRPWLLGLNYQDCGGSEAAMRVATDLIAGAGRTKRLLLFFYCKIGSDESRIGWDGETVFSDGAVAAIVSLEKRQGSGYEVLASEVVTLPRLSWFRDIGAPQKYLEESLASLGIVSRQVLQASGIEMKDVAAVFATNGNRGYHNIMASALGIKSQKVFGDPLPAFGHVFACDGIIGIENYAQQAGIEPGQYFMMVSWSPWGIGASILRSL